MSEYDPFNHTSRTSAAAFRRHDRPSRNRFAISSVESSARLVSHAPRRAGALLSIIGVLLVLGILGASIIAFTQSATHSHLSANAGNRAYYLAESGLRFAQHTYCTEGWLHGRRQTLHMAPGERVELVRIEGDFIATATADPGTAMQARTRLEMPLSLCGIDPLELEQPDQFAIFGDVGVALGRRTIIQGDVAITDDNVDIQGEIEGSVLAKDVKMTAADSLVGGDIYSAGDVDVTRGTVQGDVHAAGSITVQSANSVVEGYVFAHDDIAIGGGATVEGDIHSCEGDVHVDGNGTSTQGIWAAGNVHLGGSAVVNGDVHSGGNVIMTGHAQVNGSVYALGEIKMGNNNTITGEACDEPSCYPEGYPEEPICPDLRDLDDLLLPEKTEFTAGGEDVILSSGDTRFLAPFSYGRLEMPNNPQGDTQLYLRPNANGHGNYYFTSADFGSQTTLYLDLSNGYDIRIFIEGDVSAASQMRMFVLAPGETDYRPVSDTALAPPPLDPQLAAQVYLESHGDFDLKSNSHWFGSVYTPDGALKVGNDSYLVGAYYSGGGHEITGSTVVHVPPHYFRVIEEPEE